MGVGGSVRCVIELRQRESRAQLETPRLLLLRDGDCSEQCILGQRRIRRIALKQNLAAQAMQESPKNAAQKHLNVTTPDLNYQRRRRATVSRIWAILKAALNHAHANEHAPITDAWAGYRPFTGTAAARVRWLTDDEARRLVDVCAPDFRALVTAAILTGVRYGDLTRLTAGDYDANSATLLVHIRKTKRTHRLPLGDEAQQFIAQICRGKRSTDLLLTKADGSPWTPGQQAKRINEACAAAGITPMSFHGCRHTYASRLVMKGVPLTVVAAQLGHSSINQVEKHYGHLCPNYVSETIRQASTPIGLLEDNRPKVVTELRRSS
jgi:integrase